MKESPKTNSTNKGKRILLTVNKGFTLTELLIAVATTSILSTVALPIYFDQIIKTKQSEAAGILTNLQTSIASYVDEYSAHPTQWGELAKIAVVMTNNGPIQDSDTAGLSTTKAMQNEAYDMSARPPPSSSYYDQMDRASAPSLSSPAGTPPRRASR